MEKQLFTFKKDDLTIKISNVGAELKSLICNDIEYIWCSDAKYWNRCAPFLFPVVGTLKDKKTRINGKMYDIMQHGLLRDQYFELYHKTDNEISFINTFNENTLRIYPFKYKAIVKYTISGKSLNTSVTIINEDNLVMPFNFGGHPAFNCPLFENETFEDYSIHFEKKETFNSPLVLPNATLNFNVPATSYKNLEVLNLKKELFNIDTIIIPRVKSKAIYLLNKNNKGIKFEFPKFITLAIWTPYNDAPFVCLEPWIGYNDRFDTDYEFVKKDNIIKLDSLGEFEASYKITIV